MVLGSLKAHWEHPRTFMPNNFLNENQRELTIFYIL
jgi:hypothetical protein